MFPKIEVSSFKWCSVCLSDLFHDTFHLVFLYLVDLLLAKTIQPFVSDMMGLHLFEKLTIFHTKIKRKV